MSFSVVHLEQAEVYIKNAALLTWYTSGIQYYVGSGRKKFHTQIIEQQCSFSTWYWVNNIIDWNIVPFKVGLPHVTDITLQSNSFSEMVTPSKYIG